MPKECIKFTWEVTKKNHNKSFYVAGTENKILNVEWGDGKKSTHTMEGPKQFKMKITDELFTAHEYKKTGIYEVLIKCEDEESSIIDIVVPRKKITEIDVTRCASLQYLSANSNKIKEINFANNVQLEYIHLSLNNLTELDVHNNTALVDLTIRKNKIHSLDLSSNKRLKQLDIRDTEIEYINLENNLELDYLNYSTPTKNLDLRKQTKLKLLFHFHLDYKDLILPDLKIRKQLLYTIFFE